MRWGGFWCKNTISSRSKTITNVWCPDIAYIMLDRMSNTAQSKLWWYNIMYFCSYNLSQKVTLSRKLNLTKYVSAVHQVHLNSIECFHNAQTNKLPCSINIWDIFWLVVPLCSKYQAWTQSIASNDIDAQWYVLAQHIISRLCCHWWHLADFTCSINLWQVFCNMWLSGQLNKCYQWWKCPMNNNPENTVKILYIPPYTSKICIFEQVWPKPTTFKMSFFEPKSGIQDQSGILSSWL